MLHREQGKASPRRNEQSKFPAFTLGRAILLNGIGRDALPIARDVPVFMPRGALAGHEDLTGRSNVWMTLPRSHGWKRTTSARQRFYEEMISGNSKVERHARREEWRRRGTKEGHIHPISSFREATVWKSAGMLLEIRPTFRRFIRQASTIRVTWRFGEAGESISPSRRPLGRFPSGVCPYLTFHVEHFTAAIREIQARSIGPSC